MRWVEITVGAAVESADAVTEIMIGEGCGGTAVSGSSVSLSVVGYLPVDDRLEARLDAIKTKVRQLPEFGLPITSDEIGIKWVEDDEWADAWKKYFKPVRFGRVVVKPSWEEYEEQPGDVIVEIDPGMAFGTGNHPTTALCLFALQDCIKGGETVLDMGTGSGILAIAAARLGAARVAAYDIDPVAVEVASKNVGLCGLESVITVGEAASPLAYEGMADLVLANIIPNVILAMAENLCAKVRPGGKLITSGIILERADEVKARLESHGLATAEQREDGDWVAIISERRG